MSANVSWNHRGDADYRTDTLVRIARDLDKNPMSFKEWTWEHKRLLAIRSELKARKRKGIV